MSAGLRNRNFFRNHRDWRSYQRSLQHRTAVRHNGWRVVRFAALLGLLVAGGYLASWAVNRSRPLELPTGSRGAANVTQPVPVQLSKSEVRALLQEHAATILATQRTEIQSNGQNYSFQTTLDPHLQKFILERMDQRNSRYIGVVALDPDSGKIITMAGFNKQNPLQDPCLTSDFPAASIFKIVTAAAAIENLDVTAESRLSFNGGKYTLYKSQLKETANRYTQKISFEDAFAQSVNPVFGKLGALRLHKSLLGQYARGFGFDRRLNFELFTPPSSITLADDPYQWAEVASGFNRTTRMSPLHGALIAAAVVNHGQMVDPSIVEQVWGASGEVLYQSSPDQPIRTVRDRTATEIRTLMAATVRSGTASKAFRGYRRDRILSRLDIGGKTGSISNRQHDVRFDWFVGFAQEKNGSTRLALAVLVAHEEYIGIRAARYARMLIKAYFDDRLDRNNQITKGADDAQGA